MTLEKDNSCVSVMRFIGLESNSISDLIEKYVSLFEIGTILLSNSNIFYVGKRFGYRNRTAANKAADHMAAFVQAIAEQCVLS